MRAKRISLDTNILIYAIDLDAGRKHQQALNLIDRAAELDCVLTLQALSEFYAVSTRKGLSAHEASLFVRDWQTIFPVACPRTASLTSAIKAVQKHGLAFWNAMLWAVACDAGVHTIFTEDFQHGRELGGVRFINPFGKDDPLKSMLDG